MTQKKSEFLVFLFSPYVISAFVAIMAIGVFTSSGLPLTHQFAMSQQQQQQQPQGPNELTYTNNKDGFTLRYPSSWTVLGENRFGTSVSLIPPNSNNSGDGFFAIITRYFDPKDALDLDTYSQGELNLLLDAYRGNFDPQQYPNAEFLELSTVRIAGHLGLKAVLTYDHPMHGEMKISEIQIPVGERQFVIDYGSKPDMFNSLANDSESIIKSLMILPTYDK